MNYRFSILFLACISVAGCSSVDNYTRPENSFYIPKSKLENSVNTSIEKEANKIKTDCAPNLGTLGWLNDDSKDILGCRYYSVDLTNILEQFTSEKQKEIKAQQKKDNPSSNELADLRNHYISYLLNIADQNCETFLNRAFANKAGMDTTKNIFQDVLTGSSAGLANSLPSFSAALGFGNLLFGKTVDHINSTFFIQSAFQAIGSAIYLERSKIKEEILLKTLNTYQKYTIYDSLSDLRRYESACSIRIGVGKLQILAENAIKEKNENPKTKVSILEEKLEALDAKIKEFEALEKEKDPSKIAEINAKKEKVNAEIKSLKSAIITDKEDIKKQIEAEQEKSKKGINEATDGLKKADESIAKAKDNLADKGIDSNIKQNSGIESKPQVSEKIPDTDTSRLPEAKSKTKGNKKKESGLPK